MGNTSTVIHCNRTLNHQVQYGRALQEGFKRHGIRAEVSFDAKTQADLHVVLGPWFALPNWRFANTLMLDRAYWDDPACVSLHWLSKGEKVRLRDMPNRKHPRLRKLKSGSKKIYLCDFRESPEGDYDTARYHPSDKASTTTLEQDLSTHDIAIGRRSTALVTAAIHGLRVETKDPHSPVYGLVDRKQWITDLAWHNWSIDEIRSGAFLDGIGNGYSGD